MNPTTDWFDAEELAAGCHLLTEGHPVLPCHEVVFEDDGDVVLVDTGLGIGDLSAFVEDLVDAEDVRVVLTHTHWDHIGAVHQFDDVSAPARECGPNGLVAIDAYSDEFTQRPAQFVENYADAGCEFPDGFDPDAYELEPVEGATLLEPGDEVDVGDRTLELVPIPGHSPGQLAVLDRTSGVCHGADVLEPGGMIYAHFADSDIAEYRETVERLVDLRDDGAFDVLTTGHGDPIRGDDLSVLDDLQTAFDRIIDGADYDIVETNWGPAREYAVKGFEVLTRDEEP